MNNGWLVAVLQPRDVTSHPNFRDDEYDEKPIPQLAASILGDPYSPRRSDLPDANADSPHELAIACLWAGTIEAATRTLAVRLLHASPADPLEHAALTLVYSTAAAELERFDELLNVLAATQERLESEAPIPDVELAVAAVLQQQALRHRDIGLKHDQLVGRVAETLAEIDPAGHTPFETGRGTLKTPAEILGDIRETILSAAASTLGFSDRGLAERVGLPGRMDLVRRNTPRSLQTFNMLRSTTYSRHLGQLFEATFSRSHSVTFGREVADLFHSNLLLELSGHPAATSARRDLALVRLTQPENHIDRAGDNLRLLRHAGAKKELDQVVRSLRQSGPLTQIASDAHRILEARMNSRAALSVMELSVLAGASDLLANTEAQHAFHQVLEEVAAGGPAPVPGHIQSRVTLLEDAWRAASLLAVAGDREEAFAEWLLASAASIGDEMHQLLDSALAPAVSPVNWSGLSRDLRGRWLAFAVERAETLPQTAWHVLESLNHDIPRPSSEDDSKFARWATYRLLAGHGLDPDSKSALGSRIERHLRQIRQSAASGRFGFGGLDWGDVAAAASSVDPSADWGTELSEYVLDDAVPRSLRALALRRLAASDVIPDSLRDSLEDSAQRLTLAPNPTMGPFDAMEDDQGRIFVDALRFCIAHEFITGADQLELIAELAGAPNWRDRSGAAQCLSAQKTRGERDIALILALSHDPVVEVRGEVVGVLVALALGSGPHQSLALRRTQSMLRDDGMLVPSRVFTAMERHPNSIDGPLREELEHLAEQHVSSFLRRRAASLSSSS